MLRLLTDMPVIISDDESSTHVVFCTRQPITLSSQLTDANNDATPKLSIHQSKPQPLLPATLHSHSVSKPTPISNKRGTNEALSVLSDGTDREIEEGAPQQSMYITSFCIMCLQTSLTGKHLCRAGNVGILGLTGNFLVFFLMNHSLICSP